MSNDNPYASPQATQARGETRRWNYLSPVTTAIGTVLGFAGGWGVWAVSPRWFGAHEPWDGDGGYWLMLLLVGVIAGALCRQQYWLGLLGIYLGQVAYIECIYRFTDQGRGGLIPSPIGVAMFGMWTALVGVAVGAAILWKPIASNKRLL